MSLLRTAMDAMPKSVTFTTPASVFQMMLCGWREVERSSG
jgi:hypothetical protein